MDSKLYTAISLIAEVIVLLVRIFITIIENVYRRMVPVKEKSVAGEVILVSKSSQAQVCVDLCTGYCTYLYFVLLLKDYRNWSWYGKRIGATVR